jgi:hypothetical protein
LKKPKFTVSDFKDKNKKNTVSSRFFMNLFLLAIFSFSHC